MEIFIIGAIIVGLMVLVSTRVKRSAAKAFEPELIETDQFLIEKPEGFLYPLRDRPDFPFEAYSKLFGERTTRNIWQARVRLRIHDGSVLNRIVKETKAQEKLETEKKLTDLPQNQRGVILTSAKSEDDEAFKVARKIIEKQGKTYELRVTILAPYANDFSARICDMMRSFEIK